MLPCSAASLSHWYFVVLFPPLSLQWDEWRSHISLHYHEVNYQGVQSAGDTGYERILLLSTKFYRRRRHSFSSARPRIWQVKSDTYALVKCAPENCAVLSYPSTVVRSITLRHNREARGYLSIHSSTKVLHDSAFDRRGSGMPLVHIKIGDQVTSLN